MSSFLANLVGLALGTRQPGAARLSLPPRFASGVAADAGLEASERYERVATPRVEPAGRAAVFATDGPGDRASPQSLPPDTAARPASGPANQPAIDSPAGDARRPAAAIERGPVQRPPIPLRIDNRPSVAQPVQQPAEAALRPSPLVSPIAAPAVRRPSADRSPIARAAPLSTAVMANRAAVEREPRPVVNVTIDRIEVRAPRGTEPPSAVRRLKQQPSVSLVDYLGTRS